MIDQASVASSEIINHTLTHIDRGVSVLEASKLMKKSGTTELLVTGETGGQLLPLGIVTANDIVTRVIAEELDPAVLTTGDITWSGIAAKVQSESNGKRCMPLPDGRVEMWRGSSRFGLSDPSLSSDGGAFRRVGLSPTGKAPPLHGAHCEETLAIVDCDGRLVGAMRRHALAGASRNH